MDANEISRLMNQLYLTLERVNELRYQIERAERVASVKEVALKNAIGVYEKQSALKQKLTVAAQTLEREATQVAETLNRRREQLDSAKSDREYEALKLQIGMDEAKNDRLADETLTALSELEEADTVLNKFRQNVQECDNALELAKNSLKTIRRASEKEILETETRAKDIIGSLPREYVGFCSRLAHKEDGPIAPVVDKDYCGACNQSLPPDVVLKVSSGVATCCTSCGKLLFIPESSDS